MTKTIKQFTDPDGQPIDIDVNKIVHMTDEIKYTTVIVTREDHFQYRIAVCETPKEIKKVRSVVLKEIWESKQVKNIR